MNIELSVLRETCAINTSYPLQAQSFQVDRCVACGEIVPEGTQLCYRCKQLIEPTNIQEYVEGNRRSSND